MVRGFSNDKSPMKSFTFEINPAVPSPLPSASVSACFLNVTLAKAGKGDATTTSVLRSCGMPWSRSESKLMRTDCLCSRSLKMLSASLLPVEAWSTAAGMCRTVKFGWTRDFVTESSMFKGDRNDSTGGISRFPWLSPKFEFPPDMRAILGWLEGGIPRGASLPDARSSKTFCGAPSNTWQLGYRT